MVGTGITEIEHKGSIDGPVDPNMANWVAIRAFRKPMVAAVDGFAFRGGLESALMAARNVLTDEISDAGQPFDRNFATQMSGRTVVPVGVAITQLLAGRAPLALTAVKIAWVEGTEASLALATPRVGFEAPLDSDDKADGIRAFRDKRRPDFRGE